MERLKEECTKNSNPNPYILCFIIVWALLVVAISVSLCLFRDLGFIGRRIWEEDLA